MAETFKRPVANPHKHGRCPL